MDPRLVQYYNTELQHLREMGAEFARQYPKVAGRLALEEFDCADPYVERLLEGFAFLTSRVQLKLDSEYPTLTQHLLDVVFPNYLAPLPSMVMARFRPDPRQSSLQEGHLIPRHTTLRGAMGRGDQTACEYRTAHDVTLWPITLTDAGYFSRSAAAIDLPTNISNVKATIRLTLSTPDIPFQELPIDQLPFFVAGSEQLPMMLYEQILSNTVAIVVRPAGGAGNWTSVLRPDHVHATGFSSDECLLPATTASFEGYRLLQEYFAFPERFMILALHGLKQALLRAKESKIEILFALDRATNELDGRVAASNFSLYCTPAINLFPKVTDRIHLNDRDHEHHVVPDRTRPQDFEVFSVHKVTGYGAEDREGQVFHPFYASSDLSEDDDEPPVAYFTTNRRSRLLSEREKRLGTRSSYLGDDFYLSLVDARQSPYRHDLRQLRIESLCTNRDLPLQLPLGVGDSDFSLTISAPVEAVDCLEGPSRPVASRANHRGQLLWQLVSSLTLNYMSLSDLPDGRGAEAIRDLLKLFVSQDQNVMLRQIEGLQSIQSKRVVRRVPMPGPITFARGLEIQLTMDETSFDGSGPFLLASVLKEFFAKYVSINSFSETVLSTTTRGEIKRWPASIGTRPLM